MTHYSKEEISFIKWNEETVKELLPDIQVMLPDGEIVRCQIGGRLLPFAGVYGYKCINVQAAWDTIAHCLNNDRPLRI